MPFPKDRVTRLVQEAIAGSTVMVEDLTGTSDHYRVVVVSEVFGGKPLIKRHQMVHEALKEPLKGPIHALTIEAYTPDQWRSRDGRPEEATQPTPQMPMQIKL